ncbi:MAG: hypothetical protein ACE5GZ_13525 [Gammaproteobacteria bacterium]
MKSTPKFKGKIQRWGNSLGLRITRSMSELAHLKQGSEVTIEITRAGLMVRPKHEPRRFRLPSEATLLKGLTSHKAHADEIPMHLTTEMEVKDGGEIRTGSE